MKTERQVIDMLGKFEEIDERSEAQETVYDILNWVLDTQTDSIIKDYLED